MIKLKVEKAHGDYDYGTSKFLGAPTMPEEWLSDGTLSDDDFFFCQLKLSELREHTDCTLLPEKGFLYFFLTKENDESFIPNVKLYKEEPDTLIDDFNLGFDFLGDTDDEYSIDFAEDNTSSETELFIEDGNNYILLQLRHRNFRTLLLAICSLFRSLHQPLPANLLLQQEFLLLILVKLFIVIHLQL